jgi:Uma2 family endonuclease
MSLPLNKNGYTYKDYLKMPEDKRIEIIDGIIYNMTPSPSRIHQKILGLIHAEFLNYLKDKSCEVYMAPFDVRLPKNVEQDEDINTVVQPDVVVVCDKNKLDDKGCIGSPDLVIEIVSPSSLRHDLKTKFFLYEQAGIKEYWVVYPLEKAINVYQLNEEGKYADFEIYSKEDQVKVGIFDDMLVHLKTIFLE